MEAFLIKASKRESASKKEVMVFYNPTREATSRHLCQNLLVDTLLVGEGQGGNPQKHE